MPERRPPADRPPRAAAGKLWFLSEPDEFLRRFVLRTLLQRPRFGRGLRSPWPRR